jgi:hypothetical protein
MLLRGLARVRSKPPESPFVRGKAVGGQLDRRAFGIAPEKNEITIVGHQHLTVLAPVLGDLIALGRDPGVVASRLNFD